MKMNNNKPIISVIVPVYNVESYLSDCIDSIRSQTFSDYELLLVDDGSTDTSGKMCDEYALSDDRIRVIHQKNSGLSEARNTGIDLAVGEYITFIDSDDLISNDYLELLYDTAKKYDADIAQGDFTRSIQILGSTNSSYACAVYEQFSVAFHEYLHMGIVEKAAWAKLYRAELFDGIRYPTGKVYEDSYTTFKLLYRMKRMVCVPKYIYYYRINDTGIMKSTFSMKRFDILDIRNEMYQFLQSEAYLHKKDIDYFFFRMGIYTYNDCISDGKELEFPDEMNRLYNELVGVSLSKDSWERKYILLFFLLRSNRKLYNRIIKIFRRNL